MLWVNVADDRSFIQQRYILSLMGFMALALGYVQRFCLSLAITEMAEHSNKVSYNASMGTICLAEPSVHSNLTMFSNKVIIFVLEYKIIMYKKREKS